jgi:hypothetical protein
MYIILYSFRVRYQNVAKRNAERDPELLASDGGRACLICDACDVFRKKLMLRVTADET